MACTSTAERVRSCRARQSLGACRRQRGRRASVKQSGQLRGQQLPQQSGEQAGGTVWGNSPGNSGAIAGTTVRGTIEEQVIGEQTRALQRRRVDC